MTPPTARMKASMMPIAIPAFAPGERKSESVVVTTAVGVGLPVAVAAAAGVIVEDEEEVEDMVVVEAAADWPGKREDGKTVAE